MLRPTGLTGPLEDYFSKEGATPLPTNTILYAAGMSGDYHSPELCFSPGLLVHRGGQATYEINARRYALDSRYFCIVNDRSEGTVEIAQQENLQSCYLFFSRRITSQFAGFTGNTLQAALDVPDDTAGPALHFLERRYDLREARVLPYLRSILRVSTTACTESDELLHRLFLELLRLNEKDHLRCARLEAVKKSTREELYLRLQKGRQYMADHFTRNIPLTEVAAFACLNSFHFLRMFSKAFGETPHQYLMRIRIEKAKKLLLEKQPVAQTCSSVGFSSAASFSHLFKKYTGCTPGQFARLA